MDQNRRDDGLWMYGAGIALLLMLLPAGVPVAQEQTGPRIKLEEARFHFGDVTQGETAVHVFEFRNEGDAVLEIQKVQTS